MHFSRPPPISDGLRLFKLVSPKVDAGTETLLAPKRSPSDSPSFTITLIGVQLGTWFRADQWHPAAWLLPFLEYPVMPIDYGLRVAILLMILTSTVKLMVGGPIHGATVIIDAGQPDNPLF